MHKFHATFLPLQVVRPPKIHLATIILRMEGLPALAASLCGTLGPSSRGTIDVDPHKDMDPIGKSDESDNFVYLSFLGKPYKRKEKSV